MQKQKELDDIYESIYYLFGMRLWWLLRKNKEIKRTIYSVIHILFHIHKMDNGIVQKILELYNLLLFNNIINKIAIFFLLRVRLAATLFRKPIATKGSNSN